MNDINSYIKYFLFIPIVVFSQNDGNKSSIDSTNVLTSNISKEIFNIFEYQPTEDMQLVYDSDFGETVSRIEATAEGFRDINENDDFSYIQKMRSDENGIYLIKADQEIDLFLFISKEMKTEYPSPPLQLPKNLIIGQEWIWEGYKVEDNDSIKVRTLAKVIEEEEITVPAGTFNALRIQFINETSEGEHSTINQWLAPNVGRVKMNVSIDGGGFIGTILSLLGYDEIEFNLKEIKNIELANKD